MGKDPAMLWFWADWHSGTILMSRHLKGCYMDLLHAQFNNGHLHLDEIKTVLGADFGAAWPTLQKKFVTDDRGLFFNKRCEEEKLKRQAFVASRKNNLSQVEPQVSPHMQSHMENTNGNRIGSKNGNRKGGAGERIPETDFGDYEKWTEDVIDNRDILWEPMYLNSGLRLQMGRYLGLVQDHLQLLARYPKMRPPNQQAFRYSLLKHITENKDKQVQNGAVNSTNKTRNHTDSLIQDFQQRHGDKVDGGKP